MMSYIIPKMLRMCWWLLLLSIFPVSLKAQSPNSLKDCIEYGLKNHNSRYVYANEERIAEAKANELRSGYLPSLNLSAGIDDNLKVQESIIPAGIFGPDETRIAFTKKLASNGSVQLDQTIYDQSLITGMKANKYNRQQAALNVQLNDEAIVYNICAAYYEIFVYREQIELLQENLKSYEEQLRISRLGLEKGIVIEADVNKLQVNYNNTQSQIITAESNLELSKNRLKNAMGFPLEEQLSLEEPDANSPDTIFAAVLGSEDFQPQNRIDYKIAQTDIALLEIEEKQIKNGAFPKLTAYARYGANGFGDKLGETFNTLNDFSAIGLKLTVPLFDGFKRKSQYTQTRLQKDNAIKNLELDRQNFGMEYRNNHTKMEKAKETMDIDQRNIRLAKSVFSSVNLQYQKGIIDLTDWLNAQYSLKEAQTNYLNSLYNFCISGIDLEKSKGTLLEFYKSL